MQNYFVNDLVSIMRILGADSDPETASDFIAKYMKNPGAYRRHAAAIQQMRIAPGATRQRFTDEEYEAAAADKPEIQDTATAARLAALDGHGRNHKIVDPDMKTAYGNTGAAASADKQRWLAAKEDRENSMMSTVATPPGYSMQSGLPAYDQREQAIAAKLAALEGDGGSGTVPLVYKQVKKADMPSYRDMLETNKNLNSHDRFKQYQSNLPNAAKADQERNGAKKKAASPGMTEGNGGSGAVPFVYKQAKKAEKPSYRDMLEANKNSNSLERFKQYQSIIPNATKAYEERNAVKKEAAKPGMTLAEQMALIERQLAALDENPDDNAADKLPSENDLVSQLMDDAFQRQKPTDGSFVQWSDYGNGFAISSPVPALRRSAWNMGPLPVIGDLQRGENPLNEVDPGRFVILPLQDGSFKLVFIENGKTYTDAMKSNYYLIVRDFETAKTLAEESTMNRAMGRDDVIRSRAYDTEYLAQLEDWKKKYPQFANDTDSKIELLKKIKGLAPYPQSITDQAMKERPEYVPYSIQGTWMGDLYKGDILAAPFSMAGEVLQIPLMNGSNAIVNTVTGRPIDEGAQPKMTFRDYTRVRGDQTGFDLTAQLDKVPVLGAIANYTLEQLNDPMNWIPGGIIFDTLKAKGLANPASIRYAQAFSEEMVLGQRGNPLSKGKRTLITMGENGPEVIEVKGGELRTKGMKGVYKITPELEEHILHVDLSVPRKRGIGGAHNSEEFFKNDVKIVNAVPSQDIPGVTYYEYSMPLLGKDGKLIGGYGIATFEKTVYDSKIFPHSEYFRRGLEAADNSYRQYGILKEFWEGYDSQGVKWIGYAENGVPKSFFPDVPK